MMKTLFPRVDGDDDTNTVPRIATSILHGDNVVESEEGCAQKSGKS